eukprot:950426-Lingulodinium_polyedra.AAC.1
MQCYGMLVRPRPRQPLEQLEGIRQLLLAAAQAQAGPPPEEARHLVLGQALVRRGLEEVEQLPQ